MLAVYPFTLLKALLPNTCCLCGETAGAAVCAHCHAHYVAPRRRRCPQCANPVGGGVAVCGTCLASPPAFDATLAAVDYAAPLDQLVLQLKFGARLALAPWFAAVLRDAMLEQQASLPSLLCPVPLGRSRLFERGFNQALEIARPLARMTGIGLQPRLLVRVHETQAQSSLAPGERARNIAKAFTLAPQAVPQVRGQHVGVVDDVMTSGATLNEVAATLKRFGAAQVSNLVFARTPPH